MLTKLCFCVLWPLETASFHVHTLSPPLLQSESARKWQKARHAVGPIAQPSRFDDTKSQLSHINNKEANGENLKNHPTWRKQLDARRSNNNFWIFFSNAVLATLGGHLHVFHPVSLLILDPPHYSWILLSFSSRLESSEPFETLRCLSGCQDFGHSQASFLADSHVAYCGVVLSPIQKNNTACSNPIIQL